MYLRHNGLRAQGKDTANHEKKFGVALSNRKKLLLAASGMAALAIPVVAGILTSPRLRAQSSTTAQDRPKFQAASIKPSKSGDRGTYIRLQPGGLYRATN